MNLSIEWQNYLGERGFVCEHWSKIGPADADDGLIAAYCRDNDALVLTADLDFATLHALQGTSKPSVVQLRASDNLPAALGHSVARALTVARYDLARGAIVTITPLKVRVAKLPVGNLDAI